MQAIWAFLLNPKFLHAYMYGILLMCADGILRRLFPRFLTYSADYPEKYATFFPFLTLTYNDLCRIILAGIKHLGRCPCPGCRVQLAQVAELGTYIDAQRREDTKRIDTEAHRREIEKARGLIYKHGAGTDSDRVKSILDANSRVPTRVCSFPFIFDTISLNFHRTHFLHFSLSSVSITTRCLLWTYYTSSNWECGKPS
jgi:hypothetical protein